MKVFQRNKNAILVLACFVSLILIWEIISRVGLVPRYILPSFTEVIVITWSEMINGNLLAMIGRTLVVLVESLIISLTISAVVVVLCQKSKTLKSFYGVVATIMNSIPSLAILPLIIMWIGIGNSAIIALVLHSVLWTFTIHVLGGIDSIPRTYKEFSDNIGISTLVRLKDVYLPASLPSIISGLKIAWGRAWRSLIGAEIIFGAIGSAGGLGYYININRQFGNMDKVLGGVIIIAGIGLIIEFVVFRKMEKILKKWGVNNG